MSGTVFWNLMLSKILCMDLKFVSQQNSYIFIHICYLFERPSTRLRRREIFPQISEIMGTGPNLEARKPILAFLMGGRGQ